MFLLRYLFFLLSVVTCPGLLAAQNPVNPTCADATLLTCASPATTGSTVGVSPEPDYVSGCGNEYGVWYTYVGTGDIVTFIVSAGADSDVALDVLTTDTGCAGEFTEVDCIDDNLAGEEERLRFTSLAGVTYYAYVAASQFEADGATVDFTFRILCREAPPGPSNDECGGAVTLTCGGGPIPGTTIGTLAEEAPLGCFSRFGVWYTFTGDGSIAMIDLDGGTDFDAGMEIFSTDGGCAGNFTPVVCRDDAPFDEPERFSFRAEDGLQYFIYVASQLDLEGEVDDFRISLNCTEPAVPPANDACVMATELPVNPGRACTALTAATLAGATASTISTTCDGTPSEDVWFSFVATNPAHEVRLLNVAGAPTDLVHAIYSGPCTERTNLTCNNGDVTEIGGLVPGTTYLLQVYAFENTALANTTFDVCVGTLADPPVNDECAGALPLNLSVDNSCTAAVSGSTSGATRSRQLGLCDVNANNDDVWYTITASLDGPHVLEVSAPGVTTLVDVYAGDCAGELTLISSDCGGETTGADLTAGETYLVQVYTRSPNSDVRADFSLCVYPAPPAPVNDDCASAVTLPLSADNTCSATIAGTTFSATPSAEFSLCTDDVDRDVWYSFAPDVSDTYFFELSDFRTETYVTIYDGACGDDELTDIGTDCFAVVGEAELTAGTTYLIQVYTADPAEQTDFNLCVYARPPAPTNDACTGALPLVAGETVFGTTVAASNVEFLPGCRGGVSGDACGGSANDGGTSFSQGVWFTYTAAAPGIVTVSTAGSNFDSQLQVFLARDNNCTDFSCVAADDESAGGGNARVCFDPDVTDGPRTYYIYLDGRTDRDRGTYVLVVEQVGVLPVEFASFTAMAGPKANHLEWFVQSETQLNHYLVERSLDGISDWISLSRVEPTDLSVSRGYRVSDNRAPTEAYYRVAGVDHDGARSETRIIRVERPEPIGLALSAAPVPTTSEVAISFLAKEEETVLVTLLDQMGRNLQTIESPGGATERRHHFDLSAYSPGIYFVRLTGRIGVASVRVLKQ